MQAPSSSDTHGRPRSDRPAQPGLLRRTARKLGISWGISWAIAYRPLIAAAASLALFVSAVAPTPAFATTYDPATDMDSMYNTTMYTGATAWWSAGYTGAGVDVAMIDTGVSPVEGLATPGKIINGPDLSLESQSPSLRYLDTSGHGTFMAGLIAGKDSNLTAPYANAPASVYRGMAPDARIVSVKVGVADGGVDVSQVIAAINWVIQHRYDNGMNIRVLNISYGTNATQQAKIDPLSYAVEQAWKKGIVVVTAAGNSGYQKGGHAPGLANPAYNPYVIAVGGSNSMDTATMADDTVGFYSASSASGGGRKPDFLAPGSHLQGLRVVNSFIDFNHPEGMIDSRYFRGSGTSQSAAIVSGAVALILQKYPNLSPDQVKNYLRSNAYKLTNKAGGARTDPPAQGLGEMNLVAMDLNSPRASAQRFTAATGKGKIEGARGKDRVSRHGVVLTGERDIFGQPFVSAAMAGAEAAGNSWSDGFWNGSEWSGNSWSGNSWSGVIWTGNSWSGNSWSADDWSGNSWSGNSWSTGSWNGNSWSGGFWSGNSWSTGSWD